MNILASEMLIQDYKISLPSEAITRRPVFLYTNIIIISLW